jgi:hypothetical protein
MAFVPPGPAGEESMRMTREAELAAAELKARQRDEARDSGQPERLPLMKRILRALGRTR